MTIQVRQTSLSASEATIRSHRVAIDRPIDKGGTDIGPMGGELFLAAVGGCFLSNLLAAIKSRNVDVRDVQAEVTGVIEGSPARFSRIEIVVSAGCADREAGRDRRTRLHYDEHASRHDRSQRAHPY